MLVNCTICTVDCHPIDRPLQLIRCGHTFCSNCCTELLRRGMTCPSARCVPNMRPRDIRTVSYSVVETKPEKDVEATFTATTALHQLRDQLKTLTISNSAEISSLSHCISNQLGSLARFTASAQKARTSLKDTMFSLQHCEARLVEASSENAALLIQLAAAEAKYNDAKQCLNAAPLAKSTDTPSPRHSQKRGSDTRYDDGGCEQDRRQRRRHA